MCKKLSRDCNKVKISTRDRIVIRDTIEKRIFNELPNIWCLEKIVKLFACRWKVLDFHHSV